MEMPSLSDRTLTPAKLQPSKRCRSVTGLCIAAVCLLVAASSRPGRSQQQAPEAVIQLPEVPPLTWVNDAVRSEISIINQYDEQPVRYRQRKVDSKGDMTREVIVTREGSVARLIERDGQPITAAEDAAERSRLEDLLNNPDEFLRHHRHDGEGRTYALELVKLMPDAMLYSYAPGQPQPKGAAGEQIVLDYKPNPAFHPPSMLSEVLTGLEGRVWIDAKAKCVTRMEARVLRPVNIGFGIVAKIFPGGTVEFEQTSMGSDRWVYHRVEEHVTVRELMLKTVPQDSVMTAYDFRSMPSMPSLQQAIQTLLAMKVPLRPGS
jgi:hypothetical protein